MLVIFGSAKAKMKPDLVVIKPIQIKDTHRFKGLFTGFCRFQ